MTLDATAIARRCAWLDYADLPNARRRSPSSARTLRSEFALHRWDVVGDVDISSQLLSQPELTGHASDVLGRIRLNRGFQATAGVPNGFGLDEEAIVCFPGGCHTRPWEGNTTMAEEKMALLDVLRKGDEPDGDVLVDGLRWLLQELMDAEVSAQIGAGRYERNGERTTHRNGYRSRPWDTRLGTLELAIPKLRQGSYFPPEAAAA